MWINYSDSEVNIFHPICEKAIALSIERLGLTQTYQVLHHQHTGSLEMDFVVQNKRTGKYLCVVEVKRTPTDVHSARYQYQAMSYVQMNEGQTEAPFYILTNLEYAFSFRYNAMRPRVFQQMLSPGLQCIGLFRDYDNKESYVEILANFFEERFGSFIAGRDSYLVTLDQFASHMEQLKAEPKKWKSNLAILLYEYIRGAFTVVSRSDLHDVRLFNNDIIQICNEAAHINFQEIFGYSRERYENSAYVENNMLVNLFDFGHQNVTGDSVADVLHQIVSEGHEHEGEVPTDLELSRVLALLAHHCSGDLNETDKICGPAAGSGNLISSLIPEYNLSANQIVANDINRQLGELLTLRLGLNFTRIVGMEHSPTITCENICDLSQSYFDDVKVIVMNPPFLGGVYSVERKQVFYNRIKQLAGGDTGTNVGQMPLEAAFLELITYLAPERTIVACVFPKTHLHARGQEAQSIRKILLNRFGLNTIFNYPGKDIFLDVTRDTCILIGKIGERAEDISVISSYETIPNIDLSRLMSSLQTELDDEFKQIMPGIVAKITSREELQSSVQDGWRKINSEMLEAINFVEDVFMNDRFNLICEMDLVMKRGGAGNSGGSDLIFFDSRNDLYDHFSQSGFSLGDGMRNAELDSFVADGGDSKFLDISLLRESDAHRIIDYYLQLPTRVGSQARHSKTREQWMKILKRECRGKFAPYSVLIPRALRRKGRVHLVSNDIFVSTNFLVCYGMNEKDAILLSTWISTVFYQLICEVSSKNQEGMRKMEVSDISLTNVPKFELVSDDTYEKLAAEIEVIDFVDLQAPVARNVDKIWAEELFGDDAQTKMNEATSLLRYLANRRNS